MFKHGGEDARLGLKEADNQQAGGLKYSFKKKEVETQPEGQADALCESATERSRADTDFTEVG